VNESKNKLTVVSLFAGAGGLDIAACSTGHVGCLFSSDSNAVFLQTVIDNVPEHFPEIDHRHLVADAHQLTGDSVKEILGTDEIDIVIGGPPCDDFTSTGRKRGVRGDKAPLVFEYCRLVDETKPKVFLFENVPNLKMMCNDVFEELIASLSKLGYFLSSMILEGSSFGVPSIRKRLFIVGFKFEGASNRFRFPNPTHCEPSKQLTLFREEKTLKPYTTVRDVIDGVPDVTDVASDYFLNHEGRKHRPKTIEHLKTVPQGVAVKKSYRYRAPWDGLCRSLTAGLDNSAKAYIHPIYHREMTVREYARIHGFPDSWAFAGNLDNGLKQVANAVPIPLGCAVLYSVLEAAIGGQTNE